MGSNSGGHDPSRPGFGNDSPVDRDYHPSSKYVLPIRRGESAVDAHSHRDRVWLVGDSPVEGFVVSVAEVLDACGLGGIRLDRAAGDGILGQSDAEHVDSMNESEDLFSPKLTKPEQVG